MFEKFTDGARKVMVLAQEEARKLGQMYVGTEHLLLGLIREEDGIAAKALRKLDVTYDETLDQIKQVAAKPDEPTPGGHIPYTPRAKRVLESALREMLSGGQSYIATEHLLLGILREGNGVAMEALTRMGVSSDAVRNAISELAPKRQQPPAAVAMGGMSLPAGGFAPSSGGEDDSALKEFGRDLTQLARDGKLDPVVGRDDETERVMQILARRTKNNPLLIGDPGVGKTAVVEGLAQRVASGDVPEMLRDRSVWTLDVASLVAGAKYRGEFEERLKRVVAEVAADRSIILFIDEMHTLIGAGSAEGSLDAASILKPALSRGEIQVIGATTLDEYRKHVEKDSAFARRFQTVMVDEPTPEESLQILDGLRPRYEEHHHVRYSPDAVEAAEKKWREDATASVVDVSTEDIARVVSRATGVPVANLTEAETEKLLRMESVLHERIVGQDEAVTKVSKAIRRSRAGLRDPRRPAGSFVFLGPSGVGKTELSKALAEFLFGTQDALITFDMSEYMEKHAVSKLVGAPPGYVGYDEGGELTKAVRRRPYSVVLFDEIEKAHPDLFNILLQILEEGRLTDGQGRKVDFRNTVIIMTSNVGARQIAQTSTPLGFAVARQGGGLDDEEIQRNVMSEVKKLFKPEFLNRIDDIIVFKSLTNEQLMSIIDLLVDDLRERLIAQGMTVNLTQEAKKLLAKEGTDAAYGARPLRRAIQNLLEDPISEAILAGTWHAGSVIDVDAADGKFTFTPGTGEIPAPRRRESLASDARIARPPRGRLSSPSSPVVGEIGAGD